MTIRFVADNRDHAALLDEMGFVNAHDSGRLQANLRFRLADVVAKDVADGLLVDAGCIGDRQEQPFEAKLADPACQPSGQPVALGHVGQSLVESLAAVPALETPPVDIQPNLAGVHQQAFGMSLASSEADQYIRLTADAVCDRLHHLCVDVVIVRILIDPRHPWIQDVVV